MQITKAKYHAKLIAMQIVSGDLEPYKGAMMIWKQILDQLDERIPDDLWPFQSSASAIEDYLWNAKECGSNHDLEVANAKNEIMQAATLLIKSGNA
jgi:hypothetical protein